jgi:hypothetical protein
MKRLLIPLFLLLIVVPTALAQNDCPELVTRALEAVSTVCESTGRNQACYGNVALTAEARDGVSDFNFEVAGDIANVADIASLSLLPMDTTSETWGVAMMRVQANLPDTLPGQNVTVLLFGDVTLENAAVDVPAAELTLNTEAAVMSRPDDGLEMRTYAADEIISANGRSEDGAWVRVLVPDDPRQVGWLPTETVSGDIDTLEVVSPDDAFYAPMQAFTFRAGVGDAPCEEAPDSGILVQTPEGAANVSINANGIDISLGSTAFLQMGVAEDGSDFIDVSLIEGRGEIETDEGSQFVPAGSWSRVTLDENGIAAAAPQTPAPYGPRRIRALPVSVLPRQISIADPLTEEQIVEAQADAQALILENGVYEYTPANTCNDSAETTRRARVDVDGARFMTELRGGEIIHFEQLSPGVFAGSNGATVTINSPTEFDYFLINAEGCTITGSAVRVGD